MGYDLGTDEDYPLYDHKCYYCEKQQARINMLADQLKNLKKDYGVLWRGIDRVVKKHPEIINTKFGEKIVNVLDENR